MAMKINLYSIYIKLFHSLYTYLDVPTYEIAWSSWFKIALNS